MFRIFVKYFKLQSTINIQGVPELSIHVIFYIFDNCTVSLASAKLQIYCVFSNACSCAHHRPRNPSPALVPITGPPALLPMYPEMWWKHQRRFRPCRTVRPLTWPGELNIGANSISRISGKGAHAPATVAA